MATLDGSATQGNAALISYMLSNTDAAQVDSFSEVRAELASISAGGANLEIFEITPSAGSSSYTAAALPSQDTSGDYRLSATYNGIRLGSSDYSLSFGSSSTTITLSLPYSIEAGEDLIIEIHK